MKFFQLALLCFICFSKCYGQTVAKNYYGQIHVEITKERNPKRIYAKLEIIRPFPSGDSSWVQSLEKRLNQSLRFRNGAKKGKYIVWVKFIVSKDGSLSDVMCDKDPGFGMCNEVIRAVKKSSGMWFPAKQPSEVREFRVTNQKQ